MALQWIGSAIDPVRAQFTLDQIKGSRDYVNQMLQESNATARQQALLNTQRDISANEIGAKFGLSAMDIQAAMDRLNNTQNFERAMYNQKFLNLQKSPEYQMAVEKLKGLGTLMPWESKKALYGIDTPTWQLPQTMQTGALGWESKLAEAKETPATRKYMEQHGSFYELSPRLEARKAEIAGINHLVDKELEARKEAAKLENDISKDIYNNYDTAFKTLQDNFKVSKDNFMKSRYLDDFSKTTLSGLVSLPPEDRRRDSGLQTLADMNLASVASMLKENMADPAHADVQRSLSNAKLAISKMNPVAKVETIANAINKFGQKEFGEGDKSVGARVIADLFGLLQEAVKPFLSISDPATTQWLSGWVNKLPEVYVKALANEVRKAEVK